MNWTRGAEFAVNFRIVTNQASFTQIAAVLHAKVAGFAVRVIDAVSQYYLSLFPSFMFSGMSLVCVPADLRYATMPSFNAESEEKSTPLG